MLEGSSSMPPMQGSSENPSYKIASENNQLSTYLYNIMLISVHMYIVASEKPCM